MRRARWLVLVVVFLLVGLPRWLESDGRTTVDAGTTFSTMCRNHGGRPVVSGSASAARGVCLVRYGRRVYRMDAVTPDGFDRDAAHYQRVGCTQARRLARASSPRGQRPSFVYHPKTGVCERTG